MVKKPSGHLTAGYGIAEEDSPRRWREPPCADGRAGLQY
jgi:hypothetical protein